MKKIAIIIGLIFLFLLIVSLSRNNNSSSKFSGYTTTDNYSDSIETESDDYDDAEEDDEIDSSLEFKGYECTDDCSGHEAGYEWAEENGITQDDVDNYSGNSDSFREGMQSYVDEGW